MSHKKEYVFAVAMSVLGLVMVLFHKDVGWFFGTKLGWQKWGETVSYGVEHLGVALFIGVILKIAIENASHHQFLSLINNEVRGQVKISIEDTAKQALNPLESAVMDLRTHVTELQDELGFAIRRPGILDKKSTELITERVLNPTFIRPEYSITVTLSPGPTNGSPEKFLRLSALSSYTVENVSNCAKPYKLSAWVDDYGFFPTPEFRSTITKLTCGPERFRKEYLMRGFQLDSEEMKACFTREENTLWLVYQLASEIPSGEIYFVEFESVQVMRNHDQFVWNMGALTKRLNITMKFAGGLRAEDFQVYAREMHHVDHASFASSKKIGPNGEVTWTIDNVILPYQGFELFWAPTTAGAGNPPDETPVN